jgi:hypothetical protein
MPPTTNRMNGYADSGGTAVHAPNGLPQLVDQHGRPFRRDQIPDGDAHPGGLALPPGYLYIARVGGGDNTYWLDRYDEAMNKSREDAIDMLNDLHIRRLLNERMLGSSQLKWHLSVPDDKDPWQTHVKDSLTRQIKAIKQMVRIIPELNWGLWFGRQAEQVEWRGTRVRDDFEEMQRQKQQEAQQAQQQPPGMPGAPPAPPAPGMPSPPMQMARVAGLPGHSASPGKGKSYKERKALGIRQAWPVQGDKIGHQFDGTPYVLVNGAESENLRKLDPNVSLINTTLGRALSLRGDWRERFLIHYHAREDLDYLDQSFQAEALFGRGLRSVLFWGNWLKLEFLSKITDFYDRVGLGTNIWYYPSGDQQALEAAKKAAKDQSNRAHLFVPRIPGQEQSTALERVEVPTSGASELMKIVEYFDKQMELFVIGQEGSSSASSESGHSNHGSSEFMQATKAAIIKQDAAWLALSLTGTDTEPGLVSIMQKYSFPETVNDFPVSWEFDFEDKESQDKLSGYKSLFDMGITFKADDARAAAGASKPADGDETVKKPDEQPPGAPGGAPPGGDAGNPLAALMGGAGGGGAEGAQPPADGPDARSPGPEGDFLDALRQMREATGALRYARQQATAPDGATPPGEAPALPPEMVPFVEQGYLPFYDDESGEWIIGDQPDGLDDGPLQFAKDRLGHEHRGKGPHGGEFASQEGHDEGAADKDAPKLKPHEKRQQTIARRVQEEVSRPARSMEYNFPTPDRDRVLGTLFPSGEVDAGRVHELVGAQSGAVVNNYATSNGDLALRVDHPYVRMQTRTLSLQKGKLVCTNGCFFLKKPYQGGGFGLKVFTDQVKSLASIGGDRIETCAGRGGGMNGYYTWPRLGYDGPLDDRVLSSLHSFLGSEPYHSKRIRKAMMAAGVPAEQVRDRVLDIVAREPKTVLDLMDSEDGRTIWKAIGTMQTMTFDLKPGSRSLKVLNAYLQSKGKPPVEFDGAAADELRQARAKATPPPPPPAKPVPAKPVPPSEPPEWGPVRDRLRDQAIAEGFTSYQYSDAVSGVFARREAAGVNTGDFVRDRVVAFVLAMDDLRMQRDARRAESAMPARATPHARLAQVVNHLRRHGKGDVADELVMRFARETPPCTP